MKTAWPKLDFLYRLRVCRSVGSAAHVMNRNEDRSRSEVLGPKGIVGQYEESVSQAKGLSIKLAFAL